MQAANRLLVHLAVEEHVAGFAGGLGAIHGVVGVADHLLGRVVLNGIGGDADARGDVDDVPAKIVGVFKGLDDSACDADGVVMILQLIEDNDEFITAESRGGGHGRDGVGEADFLPQAIGDADEQKIAGDVAEAVVDDFESIEIEEEDGEFMVRIAFSGFDELIQPVVEQLPVGQAGEAIDQCGLF